ncbi:Carbamoyltransferase HypF [Gimesia alba]|uniref:Carbamoyltransferase n=1 Tax=Gimesia alba TaxID=2527973 RepID=A0A517RIW7_9PLAN|nr:carbamoyltransferase HypF [Gimesia alba]QDT43827.1 Carbamoyltransferase HypF [Gimesia alba]
MQRQAITDLTESKSAVQLTLNGRVQGIGLRPAIARWAREMDLVGCIKNTTGGVELTVEGCVSAVKRFETELDAHLPQEACIEKRQRTQSTKSGFTGFEIIGGEAEGPLATQVPTDLAVCSECLAEVSDETNRRDGYPLTSCTHCGPRYSIIQSMPYERVQTGMSEFPLCDLCRDEYQSATDRRFHAQTNACAACGPGIWSTDSTGQHLASGREALQSATAVLQQGKILGVRGLGGYQLLVDATSETAVANLRERKRRFGKPLALMVTSVEQAETLVFLNNSERRELSGPAAPIVLLRARTDSSVTPSVNPGLNLLGVMLPTTPLHWLLLQQCLGPLVVTSANLEGEPLAYQSERIGDSLKSVADLWLEHDRPIERPIDDSVVRWMARRRVTIRLARGLAPCALDLPCDEPLIALGGHQKAALALCNGRQSILGPHVGDLENLASRERYQDQLQALQTLYGMEQASFVCDSHPNYFTSQWAEQQSASLETVQHHHAHIVAGMLEQGWLDKQVLGIAFDGTGWGDDQTIWGGELLLSTATSYERVAHLRTFPLPGGERAVREPWRVAVSLVAQAEGKRAASQLNLTGESIEPFLKIINSERFSPKTSSAGRLFDGVASLILGVTHAVFEGQAAMMLESHCDLSESGSYEIVLQAGKPIQLDWRPLVSQILKDRARGVAPSVMAMRFHRGLAQAVARLCSRYAPMPVVLGGGVFQNQCLVELFVEEFADNQQPLGLPGMIPPNDGGLAAGQLAVAVSRRNQKEIGRCV